MTNYFLFYRAISDILLSVLWVISLRLVPGRLDFAISVSDIYRTIRGFPQFGQRLQFAYCAETSYWIMWSLADVMIGDSPAIAALRNYLPKVANSKATVLVTGATGTGKEIVARAVHELGPRCRHPFLAINCAAISDTLIESELFGHQRGAFTGAVASNKGLVMQAHGGTLFLDEIDAMAHHAQAKLLRVLETREVLSVGAGRPVPVDVRIVAATNQALEGLVASQQFRADLFYRLNVARIHLPPLRERKEDIPSLIASMLRDLNKRDNRSVSVPDSEMLQCLLAHDWPGNVRELRNLIETVFIDPPLGPMRLDDLPTVFRNLFASYRRCDYEMPSPEVVNAEKGRLISALQETNWNKAQASALLNCSRMTLYRKLAKYRIDRSR